MFKHIKEIIFGMFNKKSSDGHMTRFFNKVQSNIDNCGMETYDKNKVYHSVEVENRKHWDFMSEWRPVINLDIRQWFDENNITSYELRKVKDDNTVDGVRIPSMRMRIDFENIDDALRFKLTWCGK